MNGSGLQCAEAAIRYNKCSAKTCNRTGRLADCVSVLASAYDPIRDRLLRRCRLGEGARGTRSDAFAYLLDRYHSSLVRLAQQYVPSRAVAEEVVQETWLAVIEGIDRFEQRSSLKTWLFRILVNIARSHGVKENRSIPFATTAVLDDEPAVDPRTLPALRLRGRGASGSGLRSRGRIPNNARSTPRRSRRSAMRSSDCRRTSARCSRCVTSSVGRLPKCATRSK